MNGSPEKVIIFPADSMGAIQAALEVFLLTRQERFRDKMLNLIKSEMKRHSFSHIHCKNFSVLRTKDDGIVFETCNLGFLEACPKCGHSFKKAKLLTVYEGWRHERHVYGCPGTCGEVYTITWRKEE